MSEVAAQTLEAVRSRLALSGAEPTPDRVAAALRADGRLVGDAAVLEVVDALGREMRGTGPLEELLRLPGVTDVLVNGPGSVFIDRGTGLEPADVRFPDDDAVRRLAQRLAAAAGRRLDDATPWVDVRLRDGTRLHALLAPVAWPGTCLSLRVPARRVFTLDELVAAGAMPEEGRELLRAIVDAGVAFVVSGGTGSGKTTLLASMLSQVPPDERIVLVEDAAELRPEHPHVLALEARRPNVEGAGEITVQDLVRQALRMRPDRLVVGEVRGAEVVDMLAALNTGHRGGCCTVHANSAADVPARLEALSITAGLGREAAQAQVASALDVVIHLGRGPRGRRRVLEVAVIDADADVVRSHTAVAFDADGGVTTGQGARRLERLLRGRGGPVP